MSIAPAERPKATKTEQGFTIVETLVALFVFALAGVALITMQGQSISALSRVESRALANLVAENQLIEAMAKRSTLQLGIERGETTLGGKSWRWELEIAPTDDPTTLRLKSQTYEGQSESPEASVTAYRVAGGVQ